MNDIKALLKEYSPREQKLPKQGAAIFDDVATRAARFRELWMPIDVNTIELFIAEVVSLPLRANHAHGIA